MLAAYDKKNTSGTAYTLSLLLSVIGLLLFNFLINGNEDVIVVR